MQSEETLHIMEEMVLSQSGAAMQSMDYLLKLIRKYKKKKKKILLPFLLLCKEKNKKTSMV